ncbi:CvpA family protein [Sneathiella glossodoripedis]|uniref:CvpA family protein n=1 Tax=Sneathiella glossodoripedis TaxID=418853 RepID=UPI000470872E|nr:CvpA family protein [Sneathiella glossodoripedis]
MEELPINITDAVILLVLLISAVFGFMRGFVKEVLSISGWVGATFLALYLFPLLKPYTRQYIENLLLSDIITGAGIFILSLVIISFLTHAISERVKASALGALDRSLGIFFGIARAVVIVGIAWLVFVQFIPPNDRPTYVTEAKLLPVARASGIFVAQLTPPDMQANLKIAVENAEQGAGAAKQTYEAIPEGLRKDVEKTVKDAIETLDKGYDEKSRQQLEKLSKGTQ